MKIIDFGTSAYFSRAVVFSGIALALVGMTIIFAKAILGLIILVIGMVIVTAHYRIKIDFVRRIFYDYLWILGLKTGERGKFETIEYLYIKKNKVSQTMNLRALSSTVRKEVYDGYLKFSEKQNIHLMTNDNKKILIKKLRVISTEL